MNRRPLRFVALAYAALVLWVTLGPAPWRTSGHQVAGGILNPQAWTDSVTWTTGYLAEMAFNVALFLPVGMLAALLIRRRRWPLALLAGFAFTAVIELVQAPLDDRISDPRDLVMNTTGAVFGVLLVMAARMVRRSGAVAAIPVTAPTPIVAPPPADDDRAHPEPVGASSGRSASVGDGHAA
ncbi:VanZ family protein [Agromyces sp. Marseille-P2726]|uniref:VanZ family protein n=1 Tax=Agromyces sp. Marseille-P2726 TaxID=2709132 RepID=UPI00156EB8BB|nr:VanZ family protein [Agromyces sp. Marseille-P2726]